MVQKSVGCWLYFFLYKKYAIHKTRDRGTQFQAAIARMGVSVPKRKRVQSVQNLKIPKPMGGVHKSTSAHNSTPLANIPHGRKSAHARAKRIFSKITICLRETTLYYPAHEIASGFCVCTLLGFFNFPNIPDANARRKTETVRDIIRTRSNLKFVIHFKFLQIGAPPCGTDI